MAIGNQGGQPILVMPKDTKRIQDRDAQQSNIHAARVVSEAVRTTLGPRGMDKMLVSGIGDVVITNDGVTILDEMDIEHPAAKMIVEVANTQEEEVGDGTTSAVVLAGALLEQSEELLDQNIHSSIIASGFRMAAEKANEVLNDIAIDVSFGDKEMLEKVAMTAMTGKKAEGAKEGLAEMAVEAVKRIAEETEDGYTVDTDYIGTETRQGGSVEDSYMVNGLIINKDRVHSGMPKKIEDAKIALLNTPIEVKDTETDAEVKVTDPDQLQAFLDQEEETIKEYVDKIVESGANVVLCQKGIDDLAQHYLAKEGILAVRRVKKSDMGKLARATGAEVVSNIDDLQESNLGKAGNVEERKEAGQDMVFIEDCQDPKAVSLMVCGGTEHVVDETKRSLEDAIRVVATTIKDGQVVAGGGSCEIELAKHLRDYADSAGGREALAIRTFADAIEKIPRTLAENAGLDVIDALVDLRAEHDESGKARMGLAVHDGGVSDMLEEGVVEPVKVKTQAIQSGSEAAEMILRIDDVIASKKSEEPGGGPGGAPGGAPGGMPGGMPPGMM